MWFLEKILSKTNSPIRTKDSWSFSWIVIGVIGTVVTVTGVDWIGEIFGIYTKWGKLTVIVGIFLLTWIFTYFVKGFFARRGITLKIRNITVYTIGLESHWF